MIYAFGDFELDEALFELRFQGRAQLAPPRVLKALLHLIRNRARAVSRDELAQQVWGGLAVSDAALSQAIRLARRLTHDEGDQQHVIKTVRGHGFRFAAQVVERPSRAGGAASVPPFAAGAPGALVGRDREFTELESLLARAERGQGSLVFLQGEPGIGKTSLAAQLCAQASARGSQVFWGRCWEEGGAPAFWPFVQVLRAMSARCGLETLRSWLESDGAELLALVPEVAHAPPAVAQSADGPHVRFRIFDGMARVLTRMAHALRQHMARDDPAAGPALVIALDDLHAADDASLQLLRFLAPDLRDAPLLVIGTFRELEVTPQGPLAALLGGPLENTRRVSLRGLGPLDVARLAQTLSGRALAEPTAQLLHQLSGGNPFLIGELAGCSAQELELSALSVLRMPERMARAVHRRLEGLPAATRALLAVAAVIGREFSLASLCAARDCSESALLTELDAALHAGVVEPVPGSAGARVRFSHALVRDALYAELPVAQRVAMHRRIAEALEAGRPPDQLPLYELAHHFYLAAPGGAAPKAIEYALRAAAHAEHVFAFDSAAGLRDRAIELSSALPAAEPAPCDLLIAAGHAWYRAGELVKAAARYQRAAERARADDDVPRLAYAVVSYAKVRRGLALFDEQLLGLIREALAAFEPGDHALKAMLLGYRSLGLNSVGTAADREAATREAVEMARRLDDGRALAVALVARRWLMSGVLHPRETRQVATELIELARRSNHQEALLEGLHWRLQDQLQLGDFEQAERDFAEYSALAESQRHMIHRYWALLYQAARQTWAGELGCAAERCEQALSLGQRIGEPLAAAVHGIQVWNLAVLRGTTEQLSDVAACLGPLALWPAGRAWCLLIRISQRRHDDVRQLYEAFAKHDFAELASDPFRRLILACAGAGCAFLDDRARAPRLYELLAPDAELNVVGLAGWIVVGPVSQFLARLSLCMRDYERAALHFERALAQCSALGGRAQLAAIQREYAETLRRIPGRRDARAAQLLADAERVRRELGSTPGWPPAPVLGA